MKHKLTRIVDQYAKKAKILVRPLTNLKSWLKHPRNALPECSKW